MHPWIDVPKDLRINQAIDWLVRQKVHILERCSSTILCGPNGIVVTPKLTKQQKEFLDLLDEYINELLRLRIQ